ncbi:MAG: hypothetical protein KME20_27800 [Kaiparowitsia implicata GSE-PSE-MK54-09C]|jgi:hypothetical protein|nr:hypothetical protein [Kaiparowitsia implicata GSE-PSE-MK54-09C]
MKSFWRIADHICIQNPQTDVALPTMEALMLLGTALTLLILATASVLLDGLE